MTQKYTPTKWVANETIGTSNVMNNIEQGILNAHNKVDKNSTEINNVKDQVTEHNTYINNLKSDFSDNSINGNGYYKLPNGLIIQWGVHYFTEGVVDNMLYYTKPFPNYCLNITGSVRGTEGNWGARCNLHVADNEKARLVVFDNVAGTQNGVYWFAIGR